MTTALWIIGISALLGVLYAAANLTLANRYDRGDPAEPEIASLSPMPPPRWLRSLVGEWLGQLLYALVFPTHALRWACRIAPGPRPVVVIPGYGEAPPLMWVLAWRLRRAGYAPVLVFHPHPVLAPLDHYAERLADLVERLGEACGGRPVALVGHSMGGLIARHAVEHCGADRHVDRVVTLGTPHRGTWLARLGLGENARQMRPDSYYLRRILPPGPGRVPYVAIASAEDAIVSGRWRALHPLAENHVLSGVGHLALAFSPRAFQLLRRALDAEPQMAVRAD